MKSNEDIISGRVVSIQACWLNDDGSIYANIGLERDNICTDWCGFTFYDSRITKVDPSSKNFNFSSIPPEGFRDFVMANIGDVLTLVISLLEPDEFKRLFGQWKQLGLQIAA